MAYIRDVNFFTPKSKSEVTDAEAIRQELAILFNTRPPQRLFEPEYGIRLDDYLFDLITPDTANSLFFEIESKVKKYVSSVIMDSARSEVIPDEENNQYIVNLFFTIKGAEADGTYQFSKALKQP